MGCSTTGLVAVLVMCAALIFSMLCFVAPNWSMTESPADTLTNIKFTTGVWGYCVNAQYNTGTNLSNSFVDTCFTFYSKGKISLNSTIQHVDHDMGVCDAVQSPNEADLDPFIVVTGVDKAAFRTFLVLSCGSVGRSSFIFAVSAVFFGVFALIGTILFVMCCSLKSCLVSFIKAVTLGAALCNLVAFSCWLSQTGPLHKVGIHPGSCFVIEILACVSFLGAYVAVHHHASTLSVEAKSLEDSS